MRCKECPRPSLVGADWLQSSNDMQSEPRELLESTFTRTHSILPWTLGKALQLELRFAGFSLQVESRMCCSNFELTCSNVSSLEYKSAIPNRQTMGDYKPSQPELLNRLRCFLFRDRTPLLTLNRMGYFFALMLKGVNLIMGSRSLSLHRHNASHDPWFVTNNKHHSGGMHIVLEEKSH